MSASFSRGAGGLALYNRRRRARARRPNYPADELGRPLSPAERRLCGRKPLAPASSSTGPLAAPAGSAAIAAGLEAAASDCSIDEPLAPRGSAAEEGDHG